MGILSPAFSTQSNLLIFIRGKKEKKKSKKVESHYAKTSGIKKSNISYEIFSCGAHTSFFLISCPLLLSWPLLFRTVRYDSDDVEEIY